EARFELFGTFRDVSRKAVAHAAGHLSSGPEPSFRLLIGTTQRRLRIAAKHCSECPLITLGGPHPVERLGHAAAGLLLPGLPITLQGGQFPLNTRQFCPGGSKRARGFIARCAKLILSSLFDFKCCA